MLDTALIATVASEASRRGPRGALGELKTRGKRTRVVLMTSFASPDVVESARAAGAAGVLSKPFAEEQLLEVLERTS